MIDSAVSEASVRAFLAAYIAAFKSLSGARIAAFYNMPSVSLRGDGAVHSFASLKETEEFLAKLASTYHAEGGRNWRPENLALVPLGRNTVLASVDWHMERGDGSTLRQWRHSYLLTNTPSGLRILAAAFNAP